jgi:hypothetical protein
MLLPQAIVKRNSRSPKKRSLSQKVCSRSSGGESLHEKKIHEIDEDHLRSERKDEASR